MGGRDRCEEAMSDKLTDERLREIADSPWLMLNPAPLAEELLRLREENRRLSDDFDSVWNSRDEVIKERERARQACNAYWHDLSRIGSLCEQSADKYPLKAVERTVREFRAAIAKRDALEARIASMQESMSMACEEPPTNCECAGCSYAREKGGDA